jgi:RNA polymerase sigma factor FliA
LADEAKEPKPARAKRAQRPTAGKRPAPKAKVASVVTPAASPAVASATRPSDTRESQVAVAAAVADGENLFEKALPAPEEGMSRKELTNKYLPFVRSIAGKIKKTLAQGIEFDDLVSYGMLGLYEAADRYDSRHGANFMTFAYYRVRGAIYDGLRGMGWVSRTEYQRHKVEARANAFMSSMHDQQMGAVDPVRRTTAEEVDDLANMVEGLVTIYVTALDAMEGFQIKDERGPGIEESLALKQAREAVADAIERLPEQEQTLLKLYYYQEQSLEDVGKHLGLSKSWTSRLHARAIQKLTRLLQDFLKEYGTVPPGGGGAGPATNPDGQKLKRTTQPTGPPGR